MAKGRSYSYYVNENGDRVMRVSEVIKILAKDQLLVWANMLGFKKISYKGELNRTANIGQLCHSVLENYFKPNEMAVIDYEAYDVTDPYDQEEARLALTSFQNWYNSIKDQYPFHVKFTEKIVVGKELGGTIDCGIDGWKDPNKVIFVDYKTSSGFYLTQFLQLAAYAMIYEEVNGPDTIEGVMVVRLDKNGKKGEGRFISRKNLDKFILCFQCMYDVAVGTKILTSNLSELTEKIR